MFFKLHPFAFLLVLLPMLVNAAPEDSVLGQDYYKGLNDPKSMLGSVEKYHLQGGIEQMLKKHYQYAWADFNFILGYFPNHPRALLLMSETCRLWRDPRCNMETYFNKATALTPNNPTIHIAKGIYLQRGNRLEEAIESFKQALLNNPNSVNAHYNLGLAYLAQKNYAAANEHAQQAYALATSLPAGLRSKLEAAGAWNPIGFKPAEQTQQPAETGGQEPTKNMPDSSQAEHDTGQP